MNNGMSRYVSIIDRLIATIRVRLPLWFFQYHVTKKDVGPLVSLTTYPARIHDVYWTLRSLLMQSMSPLAIFLVISRDEFPLGDAELPKNIRRLMKSSKGRLRILYTDDNMKSYKKLLPVLEQFPYLPIITVDDDVIYARSLVRELGLAHSMHPGVIIGTRGTEIIGYPNAVAPYLTWPRAEFDTPSASVFLTGRGGILYPPGCLDARVAEKASILRLCPTADDIWFKAMSLLNGTKSLVINTGREFPSSGASQSQALWRINVDAHENDRALVATFEKYGLLL